MSTMTSHGQRRGRVLGCVISTAERGAILNRKAVREATDEPAVPAASASRE